MAIEPSIIAAIGYTEEKKIILANVEDDKYPAYEYELTDNGISIEDNQPHWWKYFLCGVKGVIEEMTDFQWSTGMRVILSGSIPPSSGLSSSSAVVVAGAISALVVFKKLDKFSRKELADLCAKSERVCTNLALIRST